MESSIVLDNGVGLHDDKKKKVKEKKSTLTRKEKKRVRKLIFNLWFGELEQSTNPLLNLNTRFSVITGTDKNTKKNVLLLYITLNQNDCEMINLPHRCIGERFLLQIKLSKSRKLKRV